jgi:hypothetical protein
MTNFRFQNARYSNENQYLSLQIRYVVTLCVKILVIKVSGDVV